MRRQEKEITDFDHIERILKGEKVCRLALCDNDTPYLVPLSYGYADRALYFHSAAEGKKIEILRANPQVCFEIESGLGIVTHSLPCKWGMRFETVIGNGLAEFIEDASQKIEALKIITRHYNAPSTDHINPARLKEMAVFKVAILTVTGKHSGL